MNSVLIGVHVRRTDYKNLLGKDQASNVVFDNSTAGGTYPHKVEFYRAAVKKLSERHPDNIVLILSDDVEWSTQHLKIVSGHYVASSDPHLDLAILSLCDHTVIDYGTFGVWVGTTFDK